MMIFLSIFMLPLIIGGSSRALVLDYSFLFISLKEVVIGGILGFLASIPFYTVQAAGTIIDYQRGASQMMSQDPTLKLQASTIGITFNYLMIVIFYAMEGPFYFFDAVVLSYEMVPVDTLLHPNFFHLKTPFWQGIIKVMAYIFAMGIQLGAPSIVAVLMTEMFLGIANRLAPQVQISFLGMSLKSLLALCVLWLGWVVIMKQFGKEAMLWLVHIRDMVESIGIYNTT